MKSRHLVDPELLGLAEAFPPLNLSAEALAGMRAMMRQTLVMGDAAALGVTRREVIVPGLGGAPGVRCLVYEPPGKERNRAAFLQIHGGGYVAGSPEGSDIRNLGVCSQLGIVVVSPDYRLAPEYPFPAPLDDCAATLDWMAANAAVLGIDPAHIAVGGDSAGGGLAAALVLRARDEGRHRIAFQHLVYPMLDDRTTGPGATPDPLLGEYIWTPDSNRFGWSAYLGRATPAAPAVPARAASLAGLPPTWISVGALDLFLDENIAYARRILAEGGLAELHIYPGAYHAFQWASEARVAKRFEADYLASLAAGLGVSVARAAEPA